MLTLSRCLEDIYSDKVRKLCPDPELCKEIICFHVICINHILF